MKRLPVILVLSAAALVLLVLWVVRRPGASASSPVLPKTHAEKMATYQDHLKRVESNTALDPKAKELAIMMLKSAQAREAQEGSVPQAPGQPGDREER
jgi:hypothetical protein